MNKIIIKFDNGKTKTLAFTELNYITITRDYIEVNYDYEDGCGNDICVCTYKQCTYDHDVTGIKIKYDE